MGRYSKEIELEAQTLLSECKIDEPAISVKKIAKYLNIAIVPYEFGDSVSGVILMDDDQVTIGYNPSEPVVRTRFTIAHEIGHFKRHWGTSKLFIDDKRFYLRDKQNTSGVFQEKEANAFAAALLMPTEMIGESFEKIISTKILTDEQIVRSLAKEYEVSQMAMSYRLSNLGLIF